MSVTQSCPTLCLDLCKSTPQRCFRVCLCVCARARARSAIPLGFNSQVKSCLVRWICLSILPCELLEGMDHIIHDPSLPFPHPSTSWDSHAFTATHMYSLASPDLLNESLNLAWTSGVLDGIQGISNLDAESCIFIFINFLLKPSISIDHECRQQSTAVLAVPVNLSLIRSQAFS